MFQPPVHTSYLSENLSCGEICPHDRWSGGVILHKTDEHVEKILHMTDGHVETIFYMKNVKKICYVEK